MFLKSKTLQLFTIFLLCFSFVFAPIATPAVLAQTLSIEEQLALLSEQMVELGGIIMTSPDIPDEERLVLMQQLVAISQQILDLQMSLYVPPPPPPDLITAKQAGLERVLVEFDAVTNIAKTTIDIKGKDVIKNYDLPNVKEVTKFSSKVSILRQAIIEDVANTYSIVEDDVKSLLWLTARDPRRDKYITQNSGEAFESLDRFGTVSILNKINVLPGKDIGSIEFFTDQDESLKLSLTSEYLLEENGSKIPLGTFLYKYEYYLSTLMDGVVDQDSEGQPFLKPKVLMIGESVERANIKKELMTMFNFLPFTSQVPKFDDKIIDFLTDNSTYLLTNKQDIKEEERDCTKASDKVVVTEFLRYLSTGLTAQYEEIEDIVNFVSPVEVNTEQYGTSCEMTKTYF